MKDKDPKFLFAETLRDSIHNLDLSTLDNQKIFSDYLRSFIRLHEGVSFEDYDDDTSKRGDKRISKILAAGKKVVGNVTIGVGFNMDAGGKKYGKTEWDEAFENNVADNEEKVDFDEAYEGKNKLTNHLITVLKLG